MAIGVTTNAATNITAFQAKLHGEYEIYGDTTILNLLFIVGTPNIAWGNNRGEIEPRVTPFEYHIVYPVTDGSMGWLCPNTYYEFKAWMKAFPHGSAPYKSYFGAVLSFTTTELAVTTEAVTNIQKTTATANGTIAENGYTHRGFEYYKEGDEGNKFYKYHSTYGGAGAYSVNITGLLEGTKYYIRTYVTVDLYPSFYTAVGEWIEFTTLGPPPVVTNIGAENNRVFARTVLTGEISDIFGTIVERGFEYKIQDAEPGSGDTGTEVEETNAEGFDAGEYSLRNKELYDQQYIADDIVWWFRAYCKDDGANKYTAETWMKNLPNVLTQDMTNINYNKADGNGIIISKGASDLTERGFEVKHEYSGSFRNSWKFDIAGFEGELECVYVLDDLRVVIDVRWEGELIKIALETDGLELGAYAITIGQMTWGWPLADDCLIEGKSYTCRAFASNEFGTAYGEEVNFDTWARTFLKEDFEETVGETTVVENELIENLPKDGVTASRRGFRYGTTTSADEFDVHEDGSFTNGAFSMVLPDLLPETTYYVVAYIVVNGIVYEGDMKTKTTGSEEEIEEIKNSPRGQDYREVETKVFAEVLASQSIIDFSGGKKTLSITNHLIQTNSVAKTIANNYLDRFKLAKTRMEVTFPTPLPFERGDTIDFSFGELSSKEEGKGVKSFKKDGEGIAVLMDQITMIIKKINSVNLTKTETSIEYVAVLDLEHR